MLDRMCEQPEVVPSASIVDSQSVKAASAHERGYDVHKKISGRKRHIAVDTDGRLLAINPTRPMLPTRPAPSLYLMRWSSVGLALNICLEMPLMIAALCSTRQLISISRSRLFGVCRDSPVSSTTPAPGRRAYVCMVDVLSPLSARL